ncbi:alpha/beta fold hydrolase [Aliiroseovarius sp. S2029]|uniref:alpha/beta fold hydrolase n=1 Tax=Aliiroseovarius sp. S2029 TaxID=2936988 RepID=UPI0020C16B35|nr:alpha/beta fold hydrolase [Aliiroseovarius sp. S2029]MCK8484210.1 alpha/beta fold hydrolase [Aliiroseovarius sp. S2029]
MIYAFENFTVDTERFRLVGPEGPIEAEPQALEFLIHMIRNRGQLVSKEALHQTFWPDRVVSDAALSTLVRSARRLVGDSGEEQRIIATRHGRGFVFRADVQELEGPEVIGEAMRDASGKAKPRVKGAPAIMVLPFEIVGETPDAIGLSEGVTEEVIAALARSRWFPLIARNRVRTYLELPAEARHPFKLLGAGYVVEGGILRDGDDIRLHIQLTDAESALHIHVSRHDLKYTGLFDLLDKISTIVTATVQPELIEAERVKADAIDPEVRSAWQEFVLGQHLIAAPHKAANADARAHFERALALEPGSGRIHAGLAMTHLWDYKYDWSGNDELSLGAAARDAERALKLAPDDSWAWSILAICKLTLRRFDAALVDTNRAIEVDPASGMAHGCHSWILAYSGRYEEALAAFDRAMELSPSDRRRGLWLTGRGVAQFGLGDFAGALESARELIALSPRHPSGHRMKCASLACLGRLVEARRASEHLMKLLPQHDVDVAIDRQPFRSGLGKAYASALKHAGLKGSGSADRNTVQAEPGDGGPAQYPIETTTTKDGARIAWSRIGSGPPLVAAVRWLGNLGLDHKNPFSNEIVRALSERFTLIQFDHRGMGQSQRDIDQLTLQDLACDLEAVVNAAGLDRFAMFTMAHGCPTALEYLGRNPGRIERLALYGASATGWRGAGWEDMTDRTEAIMAVARLGWDAEEPTFRRLTVNAVLAKPSPADARWLDSYLRQTISARMSVRLIEAISDYDFRNDLRALDLPTLVLHASGDTAIPISHGRRVAQAIPGAIFREIASDNHIYSQTDEHWNETLDVVMDFLDGH